MKFGRLSNISFSQEANFSANPKLNARLIRDLSNCAFIEKREHVLLYGSAGVGKTHLAQALGHQACRLGYDVLFTKAVKLFRFLLAGRADHSWEKTNLNLWVRHEAAQEMRGGPSKPACRSGLQTTLSCNGKEPLW
jgi:DNA replication protein DnaC